MVWKMRESGASIVVVVFGSVFRIVYGHFSVDGGSLSTDGF